MGKALIIKGADFSANGVPVVLEEDITQKIEESGAFRPQCALGGYNAVNPTTNLKRCCLIRADIASFAEGIGFTKVRIDIKPGFDYTLGVRRASDGTWAKLSGTTETPGASMTWVTDNQYVEVPISDFMQISGNLRYSDDTTEFELDAKLSDIATFKLL